MKKKCVPFIIGPLFIVATYLIFLSPPEIFIELTYEDGLVEQVGAFAFLLAAILFFYGFIRSRIKENAWFRRWSWGYFFLGLLFFFAFGEEISWGQRIFGWATPELLEEVNVQQETNLHNLKWFEPGEGREGLEKFFTAKWLFAYFGFVYFVLIPLLYPASAKIKAICDQFRLPIPPLWIGLLFFSNIILSKGVEKFLLSRSGLTEYLAFHVKHSTVELMESNWALIVAVLAAAMMINQKKSPIIKKFQVKPFYLFSTRITDPFVSLPDEMLE